MGATRRRLTQQLLTESLLIGVIGTAMGLAVAPLVGRALGALLLSGTPEAHLDTSLDIRVFGFAALAVVLATLVIGLVPALRATSSELNEQIKTGQHTTQAHERTRWLPRVLMSIEVALALVLVVSAGLLASSLTRLYRSGMGFDPRGVENVAFSMEKSGMNHDAVMNFYRDMGEGLSHVPGVRTVSFALIVPLREETWDEDFAAGTDAAHDTNLNAVGPDYFQTMRIPMLEGRDFRWNDTKDTGLKIILNEGAAKVLFPHEDPLGRIVKKSDGPIRPTIPYEVIGVVGDAKYENMREPAPPAAYVPMMQENRHSPSYYAVVRTDGDAGSVASAARALARRMAPGIPAPVMTSMMATLDDSLSAERMMALLSVFFAACALLVTAIGLYGTLAYATARRTSEIGIRMALGARRAQVVALVCSQNALVAVSGTMAGLIAAVLASKALASFLYGTTARDPWVLAGSVVALALIASAASLLPALRAARIDPMTAIRCE
jgi:predicted permease